MPNQDLFIGVTWTLGHMENIDIYILLQTKLPVVAIVIYSFKKQTVSRLIAILHN